MPIVRPHAARFHERRISVENKSPLPLNDPRDAVHHTHRDAHRCRRSVR